jgi:hypothetical protein
MKNFYKNLIGVMAVAIVLLGGATLARADSINVIPNVGIINFTDVKIACTNTNNENNNYAMVFGQDVYANSPFSLFTCQGLDSPVDVGTFPASGNWSVCMLYKSDGWRGVDLPQTKNDCFSSSYFDTSATFNVLAPTVGLGALTFFGGTSSGTGGGVMDAPTFLSQTADALGATASGIYPILAIVAGLILAFILISKIAGLYKQTGGQSKKNMDAVNSKLAPTYKGKLVRKSMGVWVRE